MKMTELNEEIFSKFQDIHKKGIKRTKRNRIISYLIYMLFLGMLTILAIGDVIPLPYFLKNVIVLGFIFGILYPIFAWVRNVVRWNK